MPRQIQGSWLATYLNYVADTESPEKFRLWAGISALSSALKRRVYVSRGHIKIYPNQYIVLVGPPGVGKGTAMNPATDLVKQANVANYIEDRATAESIQELLANGFHAAKNIGAMPASGMIMGIEHSATGLAPELSIFLGASDWSLQFLCTLWDKNEFTYSTKAKGSSVVKNNCFSLLGGCTPNFIRELNQDSMAAIAGGFTSRTLFAFASSKGQTIAWPGPPDKKFEDVLVNDLRHIAMIEGEFTFDQAAKDLFIDFYKKNDAKAADFESEVLTNFRARMWSHIIKNAMVLSIAESDSLVITETNMTESMKLVLEVFSTLDITFRGVGESDLADATNRIMLYIEKKGIVTRSELVRANYKHVTDEDLTRIIITLKTIDFCFERLSGKQMTYTFNPQWEK